MSVDVYEGEEEHTRAHGGHGHHGQPGQTRPITKRHVPFASLFIVAFVVVPVLETASWLIKLLSEHTGWLIAWGWMTTGCLCSIIAVCIGAFIRKRVWFIVAHVAGTTFLWGSASMFTTLAGWSAVWGVIHFFGSLVISMSWALYRIDVFRAAATGKSTDGWGSVIGLARSRPRKVDASATHVVIEVEHGPGETSSDVASAAKKLESATGAISGGTTVTPGDRADTSVVSLEMADAFANWRVFPALSHPGMTFGLPLRTAYYANGDDQWFSFVATQGRRSPHTDFASEMDTFVGAAGLTGSGKSGFLNNAAAEGLSRTDVIVCWLDKEKFLQNAGWAADMLGMGGNIDNAPDFNRALKRLAKYRVGVFGQVALDALLDADVVEDIGRKWTPELAQETGEAAILAIVDEADTAIQSATWEWLAARGRSLGIFLLPATPRVSTAEVPAVVRGSIATWKTFSVGDNYSQGFTLSQETEDAGADPRKFREPGLHYLDRAPGVDHRKYPMKAREFKSTTKRLRGLVTMARKTFTPMTFTPGAIEAMGDAYWNCHPRVVLKLDTVENMKAKFEAGTPLDQEFVPPGAFGLEDTIPMDTIKAALVLTASGVVEGTSEEERERARQILANNGCRPDGTPLGPPRAAPETPPADGLGVQDDDEQDDEGEDDAMPARANGTDLEEGTVATVDHRAAGISDAELEAELAQVDPSAPVNRAHAGESVQLDAEDPERPRWSPDDTQDEFDRVIASFADRGKMTFTNADVMAEMRCEFNAVTCSRRLMALAESERIVPPGLKVERTERAGHWAIVWSRPTPRNR